MISREQLDSRLRAFKARLVVRQALRSAFSGLAGAAAGLGLGVVFLELLPRLLFAASLGLRPLIAAAACGLVAGALWELRRYRVPSMAETALALEARLKQDAGALAAVLRVEESHPFYGPLLTSAEFELQAAENAPAPVLIRTRRLVLVPLLALASGVAFAAVAGAEAPAATPLQTASGGDARPWSNVDVGGGRSDAEREAYRKALGMKETAATLSRSAATLRDAAATEDQLAKSAGDAKRALEAADSKVTGITSADVPDAPPAEPAERAKLADKLEAAAKGLNATAARVESGEAGTTDTGRKGAFGEADGKAVLVPFPRIAPAQAKAARQIAAQTPARRALASRAVSALDKLQD